MNTVWRVSSQEEWAKKVADFHNRFPDGMISFWTDCSTIEGVLESLNQLRLLWDNQLITSEAFRVIFAEMSENGKTNYTELTMEDGERLDYGELEMRALIQTWIAFRWWSDEMNAKLVWLLDGTIWQ